MATIAETHRKAIPHSYVMFYGGLFDHVSETSGNAGVSLSGAGLSAVGTLYLAHEKDRILISPGKRLSLGAAFLLTFFSFHIISVANSC